MCLGGEGMRSLSSYKSCSRPLAWSTSTRRRSGATIALSPLREPFWVAVIRPFSKPESYPDRAGCPSPTELRAVPRWAHPRLGSLVLLPLCPPACARLLARRASHSLLMKDVIDQI